MDLFNCQTERELELKGIDLESLTDVELMNLGLRTRIEFNNGHLQDENIVVDVMAEVIIMQARRMVGLEKYEGDK